MKFLALDVETANTDYSSICQIGIAEFDGEQVVDTWETLINPEDYFDSMNVSIHGIFPEMVRKSPKFDQVYDLLQEKVRGHIVVHHMPFDKIAISRACDKYSLSGVETVWLDSAKVVRRAWEEFAHSGYALGKITAHLGIEFQAHDALQDAIAAGNVVLNAIEKSGMSVENWVDRIKKPIVDHGWKTMPNMEGNPDGELYGETIVFTGALSLSRLDAANIALELGCNVNSSVTKRTTLLVVGIQDRKKLAGYKKSSKHRKAEALIGKGQHIKIISEDDYKHLIHLA